MSDESSNPRGFREGNIPPEFYAQFVPTWIIVVAIFLIIGVPATLLLLIGYFVNWWFSGALVMLLFLYVAYEIFISGYLVR